MAEQEPKYIFANGRVINRATGESIPLDEPVFVFRAKDACASHAILFYANMVNRTAHQDAVMARHYDFLQFRRDHPERMKEPDTTEVTPTALDQRLAELAHPGGLERAAASVMDWVMDDPESKPPFSAIRALAQASHKPKLVPWNGGEDAPDDYTQGRAIQLRGGSIIYPPLGAYLYWMHDSDMFTPIVAYEPNE
jgi:hypothetical protein